MLKDCSFNYFGSRASCESPRADAHGGVTVKCCAAKAKKAWLLTELLSTAELSETLVGVFLPGPQARLVAGSVLLLTPRSFAAGGCSGE